MMDTVKIFNRKGRFAVDGKFVHYSVYKRVAVRFHEKTETWSCQSMFGKAIKLSWHDMRIKILRKLCEEARAAERRRYVAELEAKFEAQRRASMVHVDVAPKDAVEAFR
jgi:hypothetical protein